MMYNKILGNIPSLNLDNDPDDNGDENKSPMELKQTTAKSLYERLTTLIKHCVHNRPTTVICVITIYELCKINRVR